MLLHKATFSDVLDIPALSSRQPVIKAITSFDTRMQAWNLYLAVLLAHYSSCAVEFFGYQRLICSANTLLMVRSWLQYDSKFCTLAAADPLLYWDQQNPDIWPEFLASGQQNTKCWPCPYCGGTNHFSSNCPRSFLSQPRFIRPQQYIRSLQKIFPCTQSVKTALINTFAFRVKVNTPGPSAQEGELPPISAYSKAP